MNSITTIKIDPEFRDLIPPLAPQELEQLHRSLDASGCLSPLLIWKRHGILLDGHNRHAYCEAQGIPYETRDIPTSSRESAKNWIILNQLGRRNLAPKAASLLRGKLYNGRKKEAAGAPLGNSNAKKQLVQNDPIESASSTAETIAKETGVSPATVKRDAKFAEAAEKLGVEQDIIAGTEDRSKVEIIEVAVLPKSKKAKPSRARWVSGADPIEAELIEPETVVVDGTKPTCRPPGRVVESEGMKIWKLAKMVLDRINKNDELREKAFTECIHYCLSRLTTKERNTLLETLSPQNP